MNNDKIVDDAVFKELQDEAIKIWSTYDDTHGYASDKIDRVRALWNYADNYGTIIGMFDSTNQRKLFDAVGPRAKEFIADWTGGFINGN